MKQKGWQVNPLSPQPLLVSRTTGSFWSPGGVGGGSLMPTAAWPQVERAQALPFSLHKMVKNRNS